MNGDTKPPYVVGQVTQAQAERNAAAMREEILLGARFGMAIAEALFPEGTGKLKEPILKQARRNAIPLFRPWNKGPRCSS